MNLLQELLFNLDNGDDVGASLYGLGDRFKPEVVFKVRPEHGINFGMSIGDRPRLWPSVASETFGSPLQAFAWMVARVADFAATNSCRVTGVENIAPAIALPVETQRSHIQALGLDWPVATEQAK